jgi:transposase
MKAPFIVGTVSFHTQLHCSQKYISALKELLSLLRYSPSSFGHFLCAQPITQPIMPRVNKRRRHSQTVQATKKRKQRKANLWRSQLEVFKELKEEIKNPNGRSRTLEENKLLLLALLRELDQRVEYMNNGTIHPSLITWTSIEETVANDFCVRKGHLTELRRNFLDDGDVLVFGQENERGGAAENYDFSKQEKISNEVLLEFTKYIDEQHAEGRSVTNRKLRNWLRDEHGIDVSRRTVQRKLQALGLSWSKVKPQKRTLGSFRNKAIRDYLIEFSTYLQEIENGNPNDYVFVFEDESYVHNTHAAEYSYVREGENNIGRKSSKGKRLVILHAITPEGPLCEADENGKPVDDLKWRGDTPHPTTRTDGKFTCETLWIAQSSSGDYHDNMNSEMFMKWVEEKLIPTFERLFPGKKLILICDNAAYHHKRIIGSLGNLSKKKLLEMMVEYEVEYIDLPLTENRFEYANDDSDEIEDRGDCLRIPFDPEQQKQTAGQSKPLVANTQELKVAFVSYLKENRPDLLECKVEKALNDRGYKVLWLPPYCPDLNPIEMFWAAGKNHTALSYYSGRTMKETVRQLREGWYGNADTFPVGHALHKAPVSCNKLFNESVHAAGTKFVPLCDGISGPINALIVDPTYQDDEIDIPIDALVLDLARVDEEDDDNGVQS